MSAAPRPAGHPTGGIYTTAGAADMAAGECATLARRLDRGEHVTRAVVSDVLRRAGRVLEACVAEMRDPIAHCPGCAEVARRAARANARPGARR